MIPFLRILSLVLIVSIALTNSAPAEKNEIRQWPHPNLENFFESLNILQKADKNEDEVDELSAPMDTEEETSEEIDDNDDSDEDSSEEKEDSDENKEFFKFQDEDGIWRTIDLRDSLEPEELYDFHNLSWVNEPEYEVIPGKLTGRDVAQPLTISKHVSHNLYIRKEPDHAYEITTVNGRDAPFDINHPTKVLVHGWLENEDKNWVSRMKDKYFIGGDYNVVIVDWQYYALKEYTYSARKTRKIGAYLGQVLISLIKAEKIRVEDIHIVGFSLGAHIAGIAGKTIQAQIGRKVGRISGLDPARPLFEFPLLSKKKKRLVKEDAVFTDVIHTCSGNLGFKRSIGHADFYPNKGTNIQPGCGLIKNFICSHNRAHLFWSESINSERFKAISCPSWKKYKKGKCNGNQEVPMGYRLNIEQASGDYYLRTRKRSPYAMGF